MLKPRWTPEENEFLIRNYSKYGADYCAKILNRPKYGIWSHAKKLGLKYESKISKLSKHKNKIIDQYLQGVTPTDLAEKYNSDANTVNDLLRKYEVLGKNKDLRRNRPRNSKSHHWKGYGEISGTFFHSIKRGAVGRKIHFDLQIEYLWDLFLQQNRKCALSGVDIYFCRGPYTEKVNQTASLDRIDSSLGYIKGNVQWVHKHVNHMKWQFDQDEFLEWCKLITERNSL